MNPDTSSRSHEAWHCRNLAWILRPKEHSCLSHEYWHQKWITWVLMSEVESGDYKKCWKPIDPDPCPFYQEKKQTVLPKIKVSKQKQKGKRKSGPNWLAKRTKQRTSNTDMRKELSERPAYLQLDLLNPGDVFVSEVLRITTEIIFLRQKCNQESVKESFTTGFPFDIRILGEIKFSEELRLIYRFGVPHKMKFCPFQGLKDVSAMYYKKQVSEFTIPVRKHNRRKADVLSCWQKCLPTLISRGKHWWVFTAFLPAEIQSQIISQFFWSPCQSTSVIHSKDKRPFIFHLFFETAPVFYFCQEQNTSPTCVRYAHTIAGNWK